VHVLHWGGATTLVLPAIPAKIVRAFLLAGGAAAVAQTGQSIEISVPVGGQSDPDTVVVLELDRPANRIKPLAPSS
jgi:alpha-L-fucosidase